MVSEFGKDWAFGEGFKGICGGELTSGCVKSWGLDREGGCCLLGLGLGFGSFGSDIALLCDNWLFCGGGLLLGSELLLALCSSALHLIG